MGIGRGRRALLGDLVERLLKRAGLEKRVKQWRIMSSWKEIVGAANARHSWPIGLKDGVLLVGCSSPAWAQTLSMLRGQIMEKITREMGECPLREIHFRGIGKPMKGEEAWEPPEEGLPAEIVLPTEQAEWIHQVVSEISDPNLRKKAEAALGSLFRQRDWHRRRGSRPCGACGRLHQGKQALCLYCREGKEA
jgi:predicted nucleic acid-binding Zn ribbon protein